MRIEKLYFTVAEILDRWKIPEADLVYLAENDKLRLSVRVFGLPIEFGDHEETAEGERFRVPWERARYNGLLDLHARDVFQLFRAGEIHLRDFRAPHADYATLWGRAEPVVVRTGDLLLRRAERERFEAETRLPAGNGPIEERRFRASPDYQDIRCNGFRFKLGPIQAEVVRALHAAAQAGEPWQNGKAILAAAGSRSLKMADVFKSKKNWRALIESNGRGAYRLAGI